MNGKNTRIHPARLICASALALVMCALYAAGTGWLAIELVQFTTSWSPQQIRGPARTTLVIGWFAVAVPVFLAALFQSFTISVAWHSLRHRSWTEGIREASKKLKARLDADHR